MNNEINVKSIVLRFIVASILVAVVAIVLSKNLGYLYYLNDLNDLTGGNLAEISEYMLASVVLISLITLVYMSFVKNAKLFSNAYNEKTSKQRFIILGVCIAISAIPLLGWLAIAPWLIPFLIYLEYHRI